MNHVPARRKRRLLPVDGTMLPDAARRCDAAPEGQHVFTGWRAFADGTGGEAFCRWCEVGALAWTLRLCPE